MKQVNAYVLDLTKMNGNGEFPCPECGTAISPDDCDEEAYSILDIKVNNNGLEELVIRCTKCTKQLHLTGFSVLENLENNEKSTY